MYQDKMSVMYMYTPLHHLLYCKIGMYRDTLFILLLPIICIFESALRNVAKL